MSYKIVIFWRSLRPNRKNRIFENGPKKLRRILDSGPSPLPPTQKNMIFKHFLKRNDPNFHMGYAIKTISSRAHNIKFKNLFKFLTILTTSYFAKWSLPLCRKSRVLANGPSLLFGDVVYGCPLTLEHQSTKFYCMVGCSNLNTFLSLECSNLSTPPCT